MGLDCFGLRSAIAMGGVFIVSGLALAAGLIPTGETRILCATEGQPVFEITTRHHQRDVSEVRYFSEGESVRLTLTKVRASSSLPYSWNIEGYVSVPLAGPALMWVRTEGRKLPSGKTGVSLRWYGPVSDDGSPAPALSQYVSTDRCLVEGPAAFGSSGELSLDPGFGQHGIVIEPLRGAPAGQAIFRMASRKLLVVAASHDDASAVRLDLVQYLPDGRRDSTFGGHGHLVTRIPLGPGHGHDYVRSMKMVSEGKLLLLIDGDSASSLARLTREAALDPDFGSGGIVTLGKDEPYATALTLDGRGRILVAYSTSSLEARAKLTRLLPDGKRDLAFGVKGDATLVGQGGLSGGSIVVQPDGKILVSLSEGLSLIRINEDGSLDTDFGLSGRATAVALDSGAANRVALQPDGKILLSGLCEDDTRLVETFCFARFDSTGVLDLTFGDNGTKVVELAGLDAANRLAGFEQLADGRLLVTGTTQLRSTSGDLPPPTRFLTVVELEADGRAARSALARIDGTWFSSALPSSDSKVIVLARRCQGKQCDVLTARALLP